jgi:serine/threonine protein kinase
MRSTLFLDNQTAEQTKRVNSSISHVKTCYSVKYFQRLLRETGVWSTCIHPNLAPFIGVSYEVTRGHQVPCLISPFYENGTIMQYLKHNSNAVQMDLVHFSLC